MTVRAGIIATAALLLSLPVVTAAHAAETVGTSGPLSAAELHGMCMSETDVDYGYCAGYVTAVAHALLSEKVDGRRACNHGNVRSQQLVDTFNTWAEIFPDRLGGDAEGAVAAALARAFPCQN